VKGPNRKIKIYFLAAEAVPFIKVGGLGDVAGALPLALNHIYNTDSDPTLFDVRVAIPYHPQIDQKFKNTLPIATFSVHSFSRDHSIRVFSVDNCGVIFYLIDAEIIHSSQKVYSPVTSEDGEKLTLFNIAALRLLDFISWKPVILHVNDWHTALAAYLNDHAGKKKIPSSILTLHNLPFMGAGTESSLDNFNIPPIPNLDIPLWGRKHPLPLGLASVDRIVPVSPQYAREIQTSKFGCGLNTFLKNKKDKITGILNGIDTEVWNPATDPAISTKFDLSSLELKAQNKKALQLEFNLPQVEEVPLLILVSRMDIQKGIDIVIQALDELGSIPWQAILLGRGDPKLEKECLRLEKKFKKKVRSILKFDSNLSHRLYAGGDILLMPSRYEPCGLSQLIAMRYGCIPIATATGGLKDTIINSPRKNKTGYLIRQPKVDLFTVGLSAVMHDYSDRMLWQVMQRNAMRMDFSWDKSATEYARLYQELVQIKGKRNES
jgi:starch synthase